MEVAASGSSSSQIPEPKQDGSSRMKAVAGIRTTETAPSVDMTTDDQPPYQTAIRHCKVSLP